MRNITTLFSFLICFCLTSSAFGQNVKTGKVEYKTLGISFTIPDGWVGQEQNDVFMMGSQTIPGVIILTTNEATSVAQMKQEAAAGIADQNGTNLRMTGDFKSINTSAIGANFEGTAEWQPAKAYVCGVLNPHGSGVTVIAMTLKDQYSAKHEAAAIALAKSLQFKKPEYGPIVNEWKEKISGTRLTYMYSYTSIDYSNPSYTTGGGTSSKEVIDLCPQGYFQHSSSSHTHIDVGSTATSDSRGGGAGKWQIIANTSGQAVLQLNFYDGQVYEYTLSMEDKKTMLNGKRYFRTWTGENAPNCN